MLFYAEFHSLRGNFSGLVPDGQTIRSAVFSEFKKVSRITELA